MQQFNKFYVPDSHSPIFTCFVCLGVLQLRLYIGTNQLRSGEIGKSLWSGPTCSQGAQQESG